MDRLFERNIGAATHLLVPRKPSIVPQEAQWKLGQRVIKPEPVEAVIAAVTDNGVEFARTGDAHPIYTAALEDFIRGRDEHVIFARVPQHKQQI